ncbi:MAG: hypothetical protein AAFY60_00545, partial [Myxococcota bacterium]
FGGARRAHWGRGQGCGELRIGLSAAEAPPEEIAPPCKALGQAQVDAIDIRSMKPSMRHYAGNERYDIYVIKRDCGGYVTKVCVRYRETGSRVWRNSCRKNVTRSMSYGGGPFLPVYYRVGWVGQVPPIHSNAMPQVISRRLEAAFNAALNGNVTITDLEKDGIAPMLKETPGNAEALTAPVE